MQNNSLYFFSVICSFSFFLLNHHYSNGARVTDTRKSKTELGGGERSKEGESTRHCQYTDFK